MIITKVENNRIVKYLEDGDLEEIKTKFPDAFEYIGDYSPSLFVADGVVTVKPVEESAEQIVARLESALDRKLDEVANEYRYESIRTMVTYATSEHPIFGNEGRAAVAYRDYVYGHGIQCITDVQNGLRDIPNESELLAELLPFTDFLQAA
jgi:hypothetical protein